MRLEDRLAPLRIRRYSDDRTLRLNALPDEVFVDTDDLPVEEWPAHRVRQTEPPPSPEDLNRADKSAIIEWLTERKRRLEEAFDLVLMVAFLDRVPVLADGCNWMALDHGVGGTVCGRARFIGVRLNPRPEIHRAFRDIALKWFGTDLGAAWSPLSAFREYQDAVNGLGFDCNLASTWRHLYEGFYPLDCTLEALNLVTSDPPDMEALIGTLRFHGQPEHCLNLVWLAPNSG